MSEEPYTPTTDEVRMCWGDAHCKYPHGPHTYGCLADREFDRWFAAEIAIAQAEAVTEAAVIEWMGRHSSAAVSRVVEHGQNTLHARFADGVFE